MKTKRVIINEGAFEVRLGGKWTKTDAIKWALETIKFANIWKIEVIIEEEEKHPKTS